MFRPMSYSDSIESSNGSLPFLTKPGSFVVPTDLVLGCEFNLLSPPHDSQVALLEQSL